MSDHHYYPLSSDAADLYDIQTATADVITIAQALFAAPRQPASRTQYCQHVLSSMGVTSAIVDGMRLKPGNAFITYNDVVKALIQVLSDASYETDRETGAVRYSADTITAAQVIGYFLPTALRSLRTLRDQAFLLDGLKKDTETKDDQHLVISAVKILFQDHYEAKAMYYANARIEALCKEHKDIDSGQVSRDIGRVLEGNDTFWRKLRQLTTSDKLSAKNAQAVMDIIVAEITYLRTEYVTINVAVFGGYLEQQSRSPKPATHVERSASQRGAAVSTSATSSVTPPASPQQKKKKKDKDDDRYVSPSSHYSSPSVLAPYATPSYNGSPVQLRTLNYGSSQPATVQSPTSYNAQSSSGAYLAGYDAPSIVGVDSPQRRKDNGDAVPARQPSANGSPVSRFKGSNPKKSGSPKAASRSQPSSPSPSLPVQGYGISQVQYGSPQLLNTASAPVAQNSQSVPYMMGYNATANISPVVPHNNASVAQPLSPSYAHIQPNLYGEGQRVVTTSVSTAAAPQAIMLPPPSAPLHMLAYGVAHTQEQLASTTLPPPLPVAPSSNVPQPVPGANPQVEGNWRAWVAPAGAPKQTIPQPAAPKGNATFAQQFMQGPVQVMPSGFGGMPQGGNTR